MKKRSQTTRALVPHALVVGGLAAGTTGCEAIEGIFKAGVWVGVTLVLVVIALIVWAIKAVLSRG